MPCLGRWFITPHAIDAYQRRVNPAATRTDALTALVLHSQRAHLCGIQDDGVELWRSGRPQRLRFRVAPARDGVSKPSLITVLPSHDAKKVTHRGNMLGRSLRILRALLHSGGGVTWRGLCDAAGTRSERTVRRDVEALMRAGLPVRLDRGMVRMIRSGFFDWIDQ